MEQALSEKTQRERLDLLSKSTPFSLASRTAATTPPSGSSMIVLSYGWKQSGRDGAQHMHQ